MKYFVKTPLWLQWFYPECVWRMNRSSKKIYLTFDDGPHPEATSFVLRELEKFNAKATFFCIGKNVAANPVTYLQILEAGHAVGNHTQNHLNGWKTNHQEYMDNVLEAKNYIDSSLFRPPYGKAGKRQLRALYEEPFCMKPIMWTVLSGDFDADLSAEKCVENVIENAAEGAIVVFHDSEKAFSKLTYALPKILEHYTMLGYNFSVIEESKNVRKG